MTLKEKKFLKNIFKKRDIEAKKYDHGLLVVIGGSEFYSGPPALSALSAFRAGVDMVRIIAPKRSANIIASFQPDLAAFPLEGNYLNKDNLPSVLSIIEGAKISAPKKTAIVIGGGLGRSPETQKVIIDLLSKIDIPCVIDADGIYALVKNKKVISGKPFLITPHSYEFYILTGKKVANLSLKEKIKLVKEQADLLKTTILLKGSTDIIASFDSQKSLLFKGGTPFMTVGGTGDVLAGIAGALLARGIKPLNAGYASAIINGYAGKLAGKKFGESLMATDLIKEIPNVLKVLND